MKKKFNQPPPPKKEISLSEMDRNRANQLELKRFELMTENAHLREQIEEWKRRVQEETPKGLQQAILQEIVTERDKQDAKFGCQKHTDEHFFAILSEETGEIAKEILENNNPENFNYELIQCAAVIVAWLECRRTLMTPEQK